MKLTAYLITLLLLCTSLSCAEEGLDFTYGEPMDASWPGVKVTLLKEGKMVGWVCTGQLSGMLKWHALYDLFVKKEYRGNQYGKLLCEHAMLLLKLEGARAIYIQPGPFERDEQGTMYPITTAQRTDLLQKLVTFYTQLGFKKTSYITQVLAQQAYRIVGIPEDSRFLLVYTPVEQTHD